MEVDPVTGVGQSHFHPVAGAYSALAGTKTGKRRSVLERPYSQNPGTTVYLLSVLGLPLSVLLVIALPLLQVLLDHGLLLFGRQVLIARHDPSGRGTHSRETGSGHGSHLLLQLLLGLSPLRVPGHPKTRHRCSVFSVAHKYTLIRLQEHAVKRVFLENKSHTKTLHLFSGQN